MRADLQRWTPERIQRFVRMWNDDVDTATLSEQFQIKQVWSYASRFRKAGHNLKRRPWDGGRPR